MIPLLLLVEPIYINFNPCFRNKRVRTRLATFTDQSLATFTDPRLATFTDPRLATFMDPRAQRAKHIVFISFSYRGCCPPTRGALPPTWSAAPPTWGAASPAWGAAPPTWGAAPHTWGAAPPPPTHPHTGGSGRQGALPKAKCDLFRQAKLNWGTKSNT